MPLTAARRDEIQRARHLPAVRSRIWLGVLTVALGATIVLSVGIGPVWLAPGTVWETVFTRLGFSAGQVDAASSTIIWDVRLPRILLGIVVGAGLAVSGAVLQAVVRNNLADPYVLGISGGASTGAAGAILFGVAAGIGENALPVTAFLGALGATVLVLAIARSGGRTTSLRILLTGLAVGYALSATTSFLIFSSDSAEGSRSVMFWLLGSLSLSRWSVLLAVVAVAVVAGIIVLTGGSRDLDAIATGDDSAFALGFSPDRVRIRLLVIVSLITGVVVAASGAIGFVGLVVPHLARRMVGGAHARLIPACALLGAVLLLWADALARTIMPPRELPIGILTAVIGAPLLLILIRRSHAA